jgi:hypothetical protein
MPSRSDTQPLGCPPDQRRVAGWIDRRQLQQPLGLGGQGVELPGEAVLDPAGQRGRAGQAEPARQLRRAQPARQLEQRQRITPGLRDDQVPDPRIQRPGQRGLAYARVTAHYQRPGLTDPDRADKPIQRAALGMAVRQSCRTARPPEIRGHRPGPTPLMTTPRYSSSCSPLTPGPPRPASSP